MFSTKTDLIHYCREKNIRKYSTLCRFSLERHVIKWVYFRAFQNWRQTRDYEELRDMYLTKTKELQCDIQLFQTKCIQSTDEDTIESDLKERPIDEITQDINNNIKVIKQIRKSNNLSDQKVREEIAPYKLTIRKLKDEFKSVSGREWKYEDRVEICSRPDDPSLKMFVEEHKLKYPDDKITFEPIVNMRYDRLFQDYLHYSLEQNTSFKPNETKILFHGTNEDNIQSILENDFALINKIIHGAVYGPGIYFTNCLKKACTYSSGNVKWVIVCNVHIGTQCIGNSTQTILPKGVHTAVDNISNPLQFIKKKNNQYTFLGLLKIETTPTSILRGPSRFNSSLRINNNLYDKVEVLFLRTIPNKIFPEGLNTYTQKLLTDCIDNPDLMKKMFIKLNPILKGVPGTIQTNIGNVCVLGYYLNKEFIVLRIDTIVKRNKIITLQ